MSQIRAVYHFAGVYDIKPLLGTNITKPLNLSMEEAIENSPVTEANLDGYCNSAKDAMNRVIFGQQECPGLREQNESFAKVSLSTVGTLVAVRLSFTNFSTLSFWKIASSASV